MSPNMWLVDTHAHLDDPVFSPDLEQVIARAKETSVTKIITVGVNLESSRAAIALAERYAGVFAVVGWHPTDALNAPANFSGLLRQLCNHPRVVGIGETGLDYHRLLQSKGGGSMDVSTYIRRQKELFVQHLEIAAEKGLSLIIHQRDAFDDTVHIISEYKGKIKMVFHCFGGDYSQAKKLLDMGAMLSFTGIVTFKNAFTLRETLRKIPLESIMLETDAPYLAPEPFRGKRCEPAYLVHTAKRVAEVLGVPLDVVANRTTETALEFFEKIGQQCVTKPKH